jgi:16S rRNA (cytosine1402-N4)-methyltransferase
MSIDDSSNASRGGASEKEAPSLFGDIDGILMDLGVSSMHLDLPERGFSFNDDGPLDMRMGPSAPLSAYDVVNDWPEDALARIIRLYGEEKHWRLLARRICEARLEAPIETTKQLVTALGRIPGVKGNRSGGVHPATRTFQAIRIAANDELGAIEDAIPAAIDALKPGGRLAIITFHSLEDKIVKTAFRKAAGLLNAQPDRPFSAWERQPPPPEKRVRLVTRKPIVADAEEVKRNVRARSAKLRVCEKLPPPC